MDAQRWIAEITASVITGSYVRTIPLPQVVVDALAAHTRDAIDSFLGAPADYLRTEQPG